MSFELMSFELVSFELVGFRVCHLMSYCIRKLLGFREFISPRIDLFCTLYLGGVFILCWHHKDNKLLSIYRNIKSQDGFALGNEPIRGEIVCLKKQMRYLQLVSLCGSPCCMRHLLAQKKIV